MKRLILLRHAKTESWAEGIDDPSRALIERGHEDAARMGQLLAERGWLADRAFISSARRTRETWSHVAGFMPGCGAQLRNELYLASAGAIEKLIETDVQPGTLIIIGHNPGLHDFALHLMRLGGEHDRATAMRLAEKMPTAAVALFENEADEPVFVPSQFRLVDFVRPKDLVQ